MHYIINPEIQRYITGAQNHLTTSNKVITKLKSTDPQDPQYSKLETLCLETQDLLLQVQQHLK